MSRPALPADPHANAAVMTAGRPLAEAHAVAILVHGRGGSAADILSLARSFDRPNVAYLAPQAAESTWYPFPFLAPLEANEPYLGSALAALAALLERVSAAGIPAARTLLIGFSQGACLALEFAARNPRRYGSVVGLSGGLIGPPGVPRHDQGDLAGTPVFLGCSDMDPHIPLARVHETAAVLTGMGAQVTTRIYPGMGHTVNQDELARVTALLDALDSTQPD
jgi:predicted esterase